MSRRDVRLIIYQAFVQHTFVAISAGSKVLWNIMGNQLRTMNPSSEPYKELFRNYCTAELLVSPWLGELTDGRSNFVVTLSSIIDIAPAKHYPGSSLAMFITHVQAHLLGW